MLHRKIVNQYSVFGLSAEDEMKKPADFYVGGQRFS